eukprot:gene17723-6756_t
MIATQRSEANKGAARSALQAIAADLGVPELLCQIETLQSSLLAATAVARGHAGKDDGRCMAAFATLQKSFEAVTAAKRALEAVLLTLQEQFHRAETAIAKSAEKKKPNDEADKGAEEIGTQDGGEMRESEDERRLKRHLGAGGGPKPLQDHN